MLLIENLLNIKNSIKMTFIDLKKIYRGTVLGWFWIIAKPTTLIFVYWFAFSIGLKINQPVNNYPYFIWLIVGLLPWFYISEVIGIGPNIFKKYNYLVTKMTFPISTIPTFINQARLIVNLFLTIIIMVLYITLSYKIDIYFLQLPFYILIMFIYFTSLSLILAILGSVSKDFGNLIKTLITPLLFLSAIFWDFNSITIEWIKTIQLFNPITYIVTGYRNVFIYKKWFFEEPVSLIIFILILLFTFILSSFMYKKTKKEIPDYL